MGRKRPKSHAVTVGVASIQALRANDSRHSLWISPPSASTISVSFGETAVAGAGITLTSTGFPVFLTRDQVGDAIALPVHIIAAAAAVVGIMEISDA